MSRIVLMLAHSIEEAMQVQLLHELGHEVFSIGAYMDPAHPGDDKRDALPQVPFHADLAAAVSAAPCSPDMPDDHLWGAKDRLPDEVIDWGDIFIVHHCEWRWLAGGNFERLRAAGKRVIWRTVGQSTHENEARMAPLRAQGLEIVRYSPKERAIPYYAGEDALIRFWMDPAEYTGWTGEEVAVGNVTQDMRGRAAWTGWDFWEEATRDLPRNPAGPKSEQWGGTGALSPAGLRAYLRRMRAYLYTGTFPASYTLGFIEALMTGTPMVVAGPARWNRDFSGLPYGHMLLEAHELVPLVAHTPWQASQMLNRLLHDRDWAVQVSALQQEVADRVFGKAVIAEQWRRFLG
jgi:hypothetical protein